MKKFNKLFQLLILVVALLTASMYANSQALTGTVNVPTDYATLADAVNALNNNGVGSGGVTINVLAGNPQNAPTGGYFIGSATLNPTTGSANPIVFNFNNNVITAPVGTGAGTSTSLPDAVIWIAGPDYVTINGASIVENPANNTVTLQMEAGIQVRNFSVDDASQNITIQNCTINLNGTGTLSTAAGPFECGISVQNVPFGTAISPISGTATAPSGTAASIPANIVIRANTINNCYNGVAVIGNNLTVNYIQGAVVGGASIADANIFTNLGAKLPEASASVTTNSYGVLVNNVHNSEIRNNSVTSTDVLNTFYGIYALNGTGTRIVNKNTVTGNTNFATTGGLYYSVFSAGSGFTSCHVDSNVVQNITLNGPVTFFGVYNASSTIGLHSISNNIVQNVTRNAASGTYWGLYSSATTSGTRQVFNNLIENYTSSSSGTTASTIIGVNLFGTQTSVVRGNVVNNLVLNGTSTGANTVAGISTGSNYNGNTHLIDSNIVTNIAVNTPLVTLAGINNTSGTIGINIMSRNIISGLSASGNGATLSVSGISSSGITGTAKSYINNHINGLTAPNSVLDNTIKGIEILSGAVNNIYNNTIYIGSASQVTSAGANFGASGIVFVSGTTLDVRNNIINVNAIPTGTGIVSALRFLGAGTANVVPASLASTTNNNVLSSPTATRSYLYCDAALNQASPINPFNITSDPNFNTICGLYKKFMAPRESSTFFENNLVAGSPSTSFVPSGASYAQNGAQTLASVPIDFTGAIRSATPDIGATEFSGAINDGAAPTITFNAIPYATYCTQLPTITATITDASGVNTTPGTAPRLYYKKSTEADNLLGNTSGSNGWKYVEASNTTSPFTFPMNASLLTSPVALGDVIQYFIVAQDLATTPNVGFQSVGFVTTYCPTSVDLLPAGFPTTTLPTKASMVIIDAAGLSVTATADPINVCNTGSTVLTANDTISGSTTLPSGYCTPTASPSGLTNHNLTNVTLNTINNSSGDGPADFVNYTASISTILFAGSTYSISTTSGTLSVGRGVWIDYNRDGDFADPGEFVYSAPTSLGLNVGSFTVPATASVGSTRMRVAAKNGASIVATESCAISAGAEFEDYTIILKASSGVASSGFTWTPSLGLVGNPNKTVTATNVTAATTYTVTATDGSGCTFSNTVMVNIATPVNATGVTGTTTYCSSTPNTSLTATTANGSTPFTSVWSGGPIVSTSGVTAVVNPPVGTTIYTVVVTDACNTTSSTTVSVTVNPMPSVNITPGSQVICAATPSVQTVSGSGTAPSYTWMPGSLSGTTQTLNPSTATTYTITATDGSCTNTATFALTPAASPSFTSATASPLVVCFGDSVNLTSSFASGATNYLLQGVTYAPISPTSAPTVLCSAGSAITPLSGGGSLNDGYWNNLPIPFTFNFYGTNYTTFNVSTNGFITLGTALANAHCCSGQLLPNAATPNAYIALSHEDLTLIASGEIDYFVEGTTPNRKLVIRFTNAPRNASTTSGPTTGQIVLSETTNHIELFAASIVTGLGDNTTMGIENATGTASVVVPGRNSAANWTATNEGWRFIQPGISSYNWTNSFINNNTLQNPKVAPPSATTYTVTGTNAFGCTASGTVLVNVHPLISGSAMATPSTFCGSGTATLSATVPSVCGGAQTNFENTYAPANWTITQTNSNGSVLTTGAPASITMFTGTNASGIDGSTNYGITIGCPGTISFNWSYNTTDLAFLDRPRYSLNGTSVDMPTFNPLGGNSQSGTVSIPVAAGDIFQLQAWTLDNDGIAATIIYSNFSGPAAPLTGTVSFWNLPTGGVNVGTSVTPTTTTTYYAQYTQTGTGCVNPTRQPVTVTVNPLPTISVMATPNDTVCDMTSVTLAGNGAASYVWNGPQAISDNTAFSATTSYTGTYTVTGTDALGCSATATVGLKVNNLPTVTVSPSSTSICAGSSATILASGASSYSWEPGTLSGASQSFAPSSNTNYTVVGVDANNCSNSSVATINVNPLPTVTATATPNTTCANTSVTLTGGGALTYTWSDGKSDGVPFVATASNTYTVTGTDAASCSATSSVAVTINTASSDLSNATAGNASSVSGSSNNTQTQIAGSTINYYSGSCNLIASINSPVSLGSTLAEVTVEPSVISHNGQPFVPRWFTITPTTNSTATVIFYLTQDDFNDYNVTATANGWPLLPTGAGDAAGIANLVITKNDNAGLGSNPVVLTPSSVVYNSTNMYWEVTVTVPSFSQFRLHSVNPLGAALPVTITKFSGKKLETSNELTWTTSNEINNSHFNLQHSTDGVTFKTIQTTQSQAANGNSNIALNYRALHTTPSLGHNYYRLQQVDIDGKQSIHNEVIDLIWGANGNTISIYPNPTRDVLYVDLYAAKAVNATVKVLDMSGRVVKQIESKCQTGVNKLSVDLADVANGVYAVHVFENGKLTYTSKARKAN